MWFFKTAENQEYFIDKKFLMNLGDKLFQLFQDMFTFVK